MLNFLEQLTKRFPEVVNFQCKNDYIRHLYHEWVNFRYIKALETGVDPAIAWRFPELKNLLLEANKKYNYIELLEENSDIYPTLELLIKENPIYPTAKITRAILASSCFPDNTYVYLTSKNKYMKNKNLFATYPIEVNREEIHKLLIKLSNI